MKNSKASAGYAHPKEDGAASAGAGGSALERFAKFARNETDQCADEDLLSVATAIIALTDERDRLRSAAILAEQWVAQLYLHLSPPSAEAKALLNRLRAALNYSLANSVISPYSIALPEGVSCPLETP